MVKLFASLLFVFITQFALADINICDINYNEYLALYEINKYDCAPGYFLPASTLGCKPCPNGFLCPGGTFEFNPDEYQGLYMIDNTSTTMNNVCAANFPNEIFAIYEPNIYDCEPGYYLPANIDFCTQCPNGYWCAGGEYTFNEYNDQGLSPCPDGYTGSETGASSDSQCYMSCIPANLNIDNAIEFAGKDYYGTGIDTCVATKCASGYRVDNGICVENTININWNPDNGGDLIQNVCTYDEDILFPSDPVRPGYTFTGWKVVSE